MSVDLTTNSQYLALQKQYQDQIDTASNAESIYKLMKGVQDALDSMDPSDPTWDNQQALLVNYSSQLDKVDPDGSLRKEMDAGEDPITDLQSQESNALGALATTLFQQDAASQLEASGGVKTMAPDIMTRAMLVMAKLGDATNGVTDGYIDQIDGNVDQISSLNDESQVVRTMRPSTDDDKTKGTLTAADAAKLQALGVALPSDVKPDANGNYQFTQKQCDSILNSVQSQSSTLTTLNQNTTISMNKSIDVGQQCSTFQESALEKWSQLMSKILGS
jgi:hypothetical protein